MKKEHIKDILSILQQKEVKSSFIMLNGAQGRPVLLSKDNFKFLGKSSGCRIAYIDGGNAELLKSSSFSVHVIRTCCITYGCMVRKDVQKKEFFAVITPKEGRYEVKTIGAEMGFGSFDMSDGTIKDGRHNADISMIGSVVRRFSELIAAKAAAEMLGKGDIVVIDGDLTASFTGEENLIKQLRETSESRRVHVAGLSKTCSLITDKGESALQAIRKISPAGRWIYCPIVEGFRTEVGFVRLNPRSKYIFRVDAFLGIEDLSSELCVHSNDPIFLGYPYGLIEADKFARISNQEKEYLKMKLMAAAGERWKEISSAIKSNDAHEILDNISF